MNSFSLINILEADEVVREKVRQWRNKEEIRKCMLNQSIISLEEHSLWLESLSRRIDSKFWIVFLENVPVGTVYLQNVDYEKATTEWGFYIGEDAYKGRGLGRQILINLLEQVFEKMGFKVLVTKVLSSNAVAIHLYKKFYFVEKERFFLKDKREVIIFEFVKDLWLKTKEELKIICDQKV